MTARTGKNKVFPTIPYAFLTEPEHTASGSAEDVATVFLTNRECPFQCLMCDLWKNTLDISVQSGDIPSQIDFALERLPPATQIKLYNSGNFFDHKAIPPTDYSPIAERLHRFDRVIVENHPKLCNSDVLRFKDMLDCDLEVAMGLETIHPDILPRLNKAMTLEDFQEATAFLVENGIDVRAFILLKTPYMSEEEGIDWAIQSIQWAFDHGVQCCSVIPTRPGIAAMDDLLAQGLFSRPAIRSMERVLDEGLRMQQGRVFMDLWDVEQFYTCTSCGPKQKQRLHRMNLSQRIEAEIYCECSH